MRFDPGLALFLVAVVAVFALIAMVIKAVSDNRTRQKLIEARISEEIVRTLFARSDTAEQLKWMRYGLLLVGVGVGFILAGLLPKTLAPGISYGVVLLCGGAGLLTSIRLAPIHRPSPAVPTTASVEKPAPEVR